MYFGTGILPHSVNSNNTIAMKKGRMVFIKPQKKALQKMLWRRMYQRLVFWSRVPTFCITAYIYKLYNIYTNIISVAYACLGNILRSLLFENIVNLFIRNINKYCNLFYLKDSKTVYCNINKYCDLFYSKYSKFVYSQYK